MGGQDPCSLSKAEARLSDPSRFSTKHRWGTSWFSESAASLDPFNLEEKLALRTEEVPFRGSSPTL